MIWIIGGGLLMSAIALVGGLTTVLQPATLEKLLLPYRRKQAKEMIP